MPKWLQAAVTVSRLSESWQQAAVFHIKGCPEEENLPPLPSPAQERHPSKCMETQLGFSGHAHDARAFFKGCGYWSGQPEFIFQRYWSGHF